MTCEENINGQVYLKATANAPLDIRCLVMWSQVARHKATRPVLQAQVAASGSYFNHPPGLCSTQSVHRRT